VGTPMNDPGAAYVIERATTLLANGAVGVYVACWIAAPGDKRDAITRRIYAAETVTGVKEFIQRHYPWAWCVYEPEDTAALLASVERQVKGEYE